MDNQFSIERIREAQKSFFPDGGHKAVHEVRHRSAFRKFVDRLREDRLVFAGSIVILLLASLLAGAILAPDAIRAGLSLILPPGAVRTMLGAQGKPLDFDVLEENYNSLTEEEKRQIREFVRSH